MYCQIRHLPTQVSTQCSIVGRFYIHHLLKVLRMYWLLWTYSCMKNTYPKFWMKKKCQEIWGFIPLQRNHRLHIFLLYYYLFQSYRKHFWKRNIENWNFQHRCLCFWNQILCFEWIYCVCLPTCIIFIS